MSEDLPPGVTSVAEMPPPAQGADQMSIQDISDVPQYVQDRLADAYAVAGLANPGEHCHEGHDRRVL